MKKTEGQKGRKDETDGRTKKERRIKEGRRDEMTEGRFSRKEGRTDGRKKGKTTGRTEGRKKACQ